MTIYVNDIKVESFNFPGGEVHVKIDSYKRDEFTVITAELYNSDEIMRLLMMFFS